MRQVPAAFVLAQPGGAEQAGVEAPGDQPAAGQAGVDQAGGVGVGGQQPGGGVGVDLFQVGTVLRAGLDDGFDNDGHGALLGTMGESYAFCPGSAPNCGTASAGSPPGWPRPIMRAHVRHVCSCRAWCGLFPKAPKSLIFKGLKPEVTKSIWFFQSKNLPPPEDPVFSPRGESAPAEWSNLIVYCAGTQKNDESPEFDLSPNISALGV
ncbi:hypothetical protein D9M71_293220 [compost metagenome]